MYSYRFSVTNRDTNFYDLVVYSTGESGQIHLNPAAILFTPTLHFDLQNASSLLKPSFTLLSQPAFSGHSQLI